MRLGVESTATGGRQPNNEAGKPERDPKPSTNPRRSFLGGGRGHLALLPNFAEERDVAALWQLDYQGISLSFFYVILAQPRSKPRCFRAHHRIKPGIEIGTASEDLDRDDGFLEFEVFAVQMPFDHESQKPG